MLSLDQQHAVRLESIENTPPSHFENNRRPCRTPKDTIDRVFGDALQVTLYLLQLDSRKSLARLHNQFYISNIADQRVPHKTTTNTLSNYARASRDTESTHEQRTPFLGPCTLLILPVRLNIPAIKYRNYPLVIRPKRIVFD